MKILALIPARGGSKRLPGKNIRQLDGKPLIEWSIRVAQAVPEISDVLVSTDDINIAEVAKKSGAMVPWLRPAELATDTATSSDVALHALDYYERKFGRVDGLLLLQPTSPFRTKETVVRGVQLFEVQQRRRVIGVSPVKMNPIWNFKIDNELLKPLTDNNNSQHLSQNVSKIYAPNGSFYLIAPDDLRADRSFYGGEMAPLVIDRMWESLDIDTEEDWQWAEFQLDLIRAKLNSL